MTSRVEAFRMKMAREREAAINQVKFYYHRWGDTYRVWQTGSPGDVFDVIPADGIEPLLAFFRSHPAMFINAEPPEDDEV